MIDNPLPDQVMEEYDNNYLSEQFYEHCRDKAIEICKEFDVDESFYDLFTEWFTDLCIDTDEPYSIINDQDLIEEWWDQELCKSGELTPYINYEPSDDEMMSSFGTKWHDGL